MAGRVFASKGEALRAALDADYDDLVSAGYGPRSKWPKGLRLRKAVDREQPEIHITGMEFGDPSDHERHVAAAHAWARINLQGRSWRNEQTGRRITVTRQGINKVAHGERHGSAIQLVAAIPHMIERGRWRASSDDEKRRPNVRQWHEYRTVAHIGGVPHDVTFHVREDNMGHLYYDHVAEVKPAKSPGSELPWAELGASDAAGFERSIADDHDVVKSVLLNRRTGRMRGNPTYKDEQFRAAGPGRGLLEKPYHWERMQARIRPLQSQTLRSHIAGIQDEIARTRAANAEARGGWNAADLARGRAKMQQPAKAPATPKPPSVPGGAAHIHSAAAGLGMSHAASRLRKRGWFGQRTEGEEHLYHHGKPLRSAQALRASLAGTHAVSGVRQQRVIGAGGRIQHSYTFQATPKGGGHGHYVTVMRGA
jgi:hypothetical protein